MRDTFAGWMERGRRYADKVMALQNDSFEKTIAVALAICFICAVLVSFSAVALKPLQVYNKAVDMKKNILDVAGLLEADVSIDEAFKQIETKIVDLETGDYVEDIDPASYDQRKAAKDPAMSIKIPPEEDIAGIKTKAKYATVYLVKKGGQIESIILPVHGYGLWSTMYGFLALAGDARMVRSINFYDQAETPGLGGEIVNPDWRALWRGKTVYNEQGEPVLRLIKGSVDPNKPGAEHQVDGLAGATLTSNGVTNLVRYWLGKNGFAPYLDKIRSVRG
ncbi:MAG: Na(+)-translocating NADH-quinone reductase subunit C [Pseudomonadota bacterium]